MLGLVSLGIIFSRALNLSVDSETVEQEAQALFEYEIPEGSQGMLTMNIFGIEMIQVTDTHEPHRVLLTMGRIPPLFQEENARGAFMEGLQESLAEDEGYRFRSLSTKSLSLCDQTVDVIIETGTLERSGENLPAVSYLTSVNYQGSERFAWILANGNQAAEKAQTVLASLECR